jgi:hypothetical protein
MKRAALWASVLLLAACGGTAPTGSITSPSPIATASGDLAVRDRHRRRDLEKMRNRVANSARTSGKVLHLAGVLLAITTLLAACSGTTPTGSVTSPSPLATASPSPHSSPSPVPAGVCSASSRCLALVTLRGSDAVVVRDITDINRPVTVSTLPAGMPVFVSSTELSDEETTNLYRMPLSGSPKTVIAKHVGLFAWNAAGTAAGYMTFDGLHVVSAGRDRVFGQPLPVPAGGYGCESQVCADSWDGRLLFSPDGAYISLVVVSGPVTGFKLWSSDGRLMSLPKAPAGTMSVWSGRSLYFRDTTGVEAWTEGVTSTFLPGVQWVRPKSSPAGGAIVYETRDASGVAHVDLVDTNTKKVRELKAGRSEPAFLTARYVWYQGERLCLASDQCVVGPTVPTGKYYIYDLQTGTEYNSIITGVADIWPHAT